MDYLEIERIYQSDKGEMYTQHAEFLYQLGLKSQTSIEKCRIMESALILDKANEKIALELGLLYLFQLNLEKSSIYLLEKVFDETQVRKPISLDQKNYYFLSLLIARFFINEGNIARSLKMLRRIIQASPSQFDDTVHIMRATLFEEFPICTNECMKLKDNYMQNLDNLLKKTNLNIDCALLDSDPLLFCMSSPFIIECYYEFDFREVMTKYVALMTRLFPELLYTSKFLTKESKNQEEQKNKKKLAVISSFFYENTSVLCDFQGVLNNLSRDEFEITYIYINTAHSHSTFLENNQIDKKIIISNFHKGWLDENRILVERCEFDIIFYLEPVMSHHIQKLMLSKLAPVQIVSHGHPVTSGVSSDIMNYYVSWEGAELDYEQSKHHYSENLYLLPKDSIHQYYGPRSKDGISLINNQPFHNITRDYFEELYNFRGKNWYLCMQKPFKCHPEMIQMIEGISQKDENSMIILHKSDKEEKCALEKYFKRTETYKRVLFLPHQPHHLLMALYNLSDVVLDSYYAGGCTTSREALELGTPIVTLPAKYLGGRWTYGIYNIIGVHDLICNSKEEYVEKACLYGMNKDKNQEMREKIKDNISKIFYQRTAIENWTKALNHFYEISQDSI
tara:strand:+ start:178 stop:2043 length:1866 start_codon:yes stop_codon:yes gene_type:complete